MRVRTILRLHAIEHALVVLHAMQLKDIGLREVLEAWLLVNLLAFVAQITELDLLWRTTQLHLHVLGLERQTLVLLHCSWLMLLLILLQLLLV